MIIEEKRRINIAVTGNTELISEVFTLGFIQGQYAQVKGMLEDDISLSQESKDRQLKIIEKSYHRNQKQSCDKIRNILGVDGAMSFDVETAELILFDYDPSQVDTFKRSVTTGKNTGKCFIDLEEDLNEKI